MRLCLDAIIQFSKTRGHVGMGEELRLGEPAESLSRIRVPAGGVQDNQGSHIVVTGLRRIESERLLHPLDRFGSLAQASQQISPLRDHAGIVRVERQRPLLMVFSPVQNPSGSD